MGEPVEVIRTAALEGIVHGFLGRRGGVSAGDFAGLNVGLGSEDDRAAVVRNRELAARAVLPGAELVTAFQVHSADVVIVEAGWADDARPRADALVTDRPGLLLGILTADCAPLLFADRAAGVIGAAHAGWKGALGGVAQATIAAMERLGAKRANIAVATGPCIAQASYEVDAAFRDRFIAADRKNGRFFAPGTRAAHYLFDLPGYLVAQLAGAGIATIIDLTLDTYAAPERFFSYRRATHRGEPGYGRQISLIALR